MEAMPTFPLHDEQILKAAKSGDVELLQKLRDESDDDDAFRRRCEFVREVEGISCLHLAAEKGDIKICRFLVEDVKLDVNIKTDNGDSPLLFAASNGQFATAKCLILRGADVEYSGYEGITCLHIAAEKGNKELMQLLLLKGADIEALSVRGSPLQCAALCGNFESVRFLLMRGAYPDSVSPLSVPPLVGAISCSSSECFQLLLKAGADPNINYPGLCPLAAAAKISNTEFLKSLLAAGADPDTLTVRGLTPIEHAAETGNLEGVRILFPLTEYIPGYPDWTVTGITDYIHTEESKSQKKLTIRIYFKFIDVKGIIAVERGDYINAVKWFSEAICHQPDDEKMLSNRSLCWTHLHEYAFALCDAEACVKLKPDWPKAHYRAGSAWMLLKNYVKACASFMTAKYLDPGSMEIKKALCDALKWSILMQAELNLPKTVSTLPCLVPFPDSDTFYPFLLYLAEENPLEAMRVLRNFLEVPSLSRFL